MKIVPVLPYTPEWQAWRAGRDLHDGPRITETAAAIIAGHSRSTSVQRLWQELTGRTEPRTPSDGRVGESAVLAELRARCAQACGVVLESACVESDRHPWIGATIDGISTKPERLYSLVSPAKAEWEMLLAGQLPARHAARLQWQMLCASTADGGTVKAVLFACPLSPVDAGASVTPVIMDVEPDVDLQHDLLERARRFREAVVGNVPPAGSRFEQAAHQWLLAWRERERATQALERARSRLVALYPSDVDTLSAGGVTVFRAQRGDDDTDGQVRLVVKCSGEAEKVLAELDEKSVPIEDLPAQEDPCREPVSELPSAAPQLEW